MTSTPGAWNAIMIATLSSGNGGQVINQVQVN
jgi:protein subunit release factor B